MSYRSSKPKKKNTCSRCGGGHPNFSSCKAPITSFRDLQGSGYHDWHDIKGPDNAGFGQPLPDMGSDIFMRKETDGE